MRQKLSSGHSDLLLPLPSAALRRPPTPPHCVFIRKEVLFSPFPMGLGRLISLLQITNW